MYCFTEDWATAKAALDLGFCISISGTLTFKTAADLREVAAPVPSDRLLIETDSACLAPVPHRGGPNEPRYVAPVAECVAALGSMTLEAVADLTAANFSALFGV